MAVGLERPAALARHHKHRAVEAVGDRRGDLSGVSGVKNCKPDAGGGRDHFGRQRRPTHAGKDHVVNAVGSQPSVQVAQFGDVLP